MVTRTARVAGVMTIFGAVAALYGWRRTRLRAADAIRRAPAGPIDIASRAARTAEMAKLSGKIGAGAAVHQAQRVFASAGRKEVLDAAFQLRTAEQVAETLGSMKGALMKLGQMASYLDDAMPEPIREALAALQSDAPPMAPELAAQVVEQELRAPPDQVFATWDEVPIAAASIGQVHRAMTHDGRAVAVKVQYPGVDRAIASDLANTDLLMTAMGLIYPGLEAGPIVEELKARLTEELDYTLEAEHQRRFAGFFAGHPFIHVPGVVDDLSTRRVLTTELASGARFSEIESWPQEEKDLAAETIFRFVFRSLYRMHSFNGDPHPGNYLFTKGGQVTFLDYGLVKRFTVAETALFERMIGSFVIERDHDRFRSILEEIGMLVPGAPVSTEQVADYFGYFYEMVMEQGAITITPEYASESVRQVFASGHPVTKHANVPPAFVIIQRINMGMYAILGRLAATAPWRSIAEEMWPMIDGPPSTELGRAEQVWWDKARRRKP